MTPENTPFQDELLYKDVFFHFAPVYVSNHPVDKNFQVDDAVMKQFENYLTDQGIDWTPADMTADSDWVKSHIKQEIVTIQFGQLQGLRVIADWDPEIQKALGFCPRPQALETTAQKVMAEKAEARNPATQGVPNQQ